MSQQGFTFIEVLLSVTIMTMLVGLTLPVYEGFVRRNDLDLTAQTLSSSLRRAALYARAVNGDSTWGVYFTTNSSTLFKGASYASRDTTFDETTLLPGSMTLTGGEVVFAKLTAAPNVTGSVILTSTTNDARTISLNAKGMVNYQ